MSCWGWAQGKTLVGLCLQRSAWKRDRANSGYGFIYLYISLLYSRGMETLHKPAGESAAAGATVQSAQRCLHLWFNWSIPTNLSNCFWTWWFQSIQCAQNGHEHQTGETDLRKPFQILPVHGDICTIQRIHLMTMDRRIPCTSTQSSWYFKQTFTELFMSELMPRSHVWELSDV